MAHIQREPFEDPAEYKCSKGSRVLNRELVLKGKKDIVIMHRLPRIDEIATDLDNLPNSAYFRQVHIGIYPCMSLLAMVLERA